MLKIRVFFFFFVNVRNIFILLDKKVLPVQESWVQCLNSSGFLFISYPRKRFYRINLFWLSLKLFGNYFFFCIIASDRKLLELIPVWQTKFLLLIKWAAIQKDLKLSPKKGAVKIIMECIDRKLHIYYYKYNGVLLNHLVYS